LDNAFALDRKTPRTLFNLLFRPGFLAEEYRLGRIVRYVHPVKLFWMSSIILFALLIAQISFDNKKSDTTEADMHLNLKFRGDNQENDITATETDAKEVTFTIETPSDSIVIHPSDFKDNDNVTIKKTHAEFIQFFTDLFKSYAPYVTFLLIPIFALLLQGFFWRKRYFYMFHMVFAVYLHAFLWIFFCLLLIVGKLTPNWDYPEWLSFILSLIPSIYLIFALRRFYHASWWQSVWKTVLIYAIYFIVILIVTVFAFWALMSIYFPELL